MKIDYNNEKLITALKDSKAIYADIMTVRGIDDNQLNKLNRFNKLSQFDKDLMLLTATKPIPEVAELYGISRQYVYKLLKKIKLKLNGELDTN